MGCVRRPETLSSEEIRSVLAYRTDDDARPAWLEAAATAAGVVGVDALLCRLGRSVADALRAVAASAETSRSRLRTLRASLLAAVNSRCDELGVRIDDAETSKTAALERELSAVDASLERWRAAYLGVSEAAVSPDDTPCDRYIELAARMDDANAQLTDLPVAAVEPPHVGLSVAGMPALLASIAGFGRVKAPLPISAADLTAGYAPLHVRPRGVLRLTFVLTSPRHDAQSAEELEVSLGAVAAASHSTASLTGGGAAARPLALVVRADVPGRCVTVTCVVPADARGTVNTRLLALRWTVSDALREDTTPCFPVYHSMETPLRCVAEEGVGAPTALCISDHGELLVPSQRRRAVLVFGSDGAPLSPVPIDALGAPARLVAFVDDGDRRGGFGLLVADAARLFAARRHDGSACWQREPTCDGFAVLSDRNVGVGTAAATETLFAYQLEDGGGAGAVHVQGLVGAVAADAASGDVFVAARTDERISVFRYAWAPDLGFSYRGAYSVRGTAEGPVGALLLAVVPPVAGRRFAHLVVGTTGTPALLVLALPGLALVHTHDLAGVRATALAADPGGGALAVGDAVTGATLVLAWPLPGMPAME